MLKKLVVGALVSTVVATSASVAVAQEWPSAKPIRVIAVFPPGGSVDQVARILGEALRVQLNQYGAGIHALEELAGQDAAHIRDFSPACLPEELAEITLMAAESVRRFGIEPRVALLSHSNFGSADCPSASKMRKTLELVKASAPTVYQLIDSELMAGYTLAATTAIPETAFGNVAPTTPLRLEAGDMLYVGSQVALAAGIVFYAEQAEL